MVDAWAKSNVFFLFGISVKVEFLDLLNYLFDFTYDHLYRAVMRPGTNSLAFFTYVNKALLQFILQKLLSSNVDIFWSLLLFEIAVRSLGVLPRVSSILELLNNCCVLKKPQSIYICHGLAILIILGSIWWSCMGCLPTSVCLLLLSSIVTA